MGSVLTTTLPYPLLPAYTKQAINRLAVLTVPRLLSISSPQFSREWLSEKLRQVLVAGQHLQIAIKAVEAAEKEDDEVADAVLRAAAAELKPIPQERLTAAQSQVADYGVRALFRQPLKRGRGRYGKFDHWLRNMNACVLVMFACWKYGVRPTRQRESRRAELWPSGCSLVAAALGLNKIRIDEKTLQNKIWLGLPGALVRAIPQDELVRVFETWR